jgi:capsid protein
MEAVATRIKGDEPKVQAMKRLLDHAKAGSFGKPFPKKSADIGAGFGYSRILFTHSYDGEKNFGEIGPPKSYLPNYQLLRVRSWQSMLESEIAQTIIGRYVTWVIGDGLKLQSEPGELVLKSFGITVDKTIFSTNVEAFYSLYSESREADHSRMQTKNELSIAAFTNAIVGGDVLVVLRYEDDKPTVQLVDGAHVRSPYGGNEVYARMLPDGNRIENGVELSPANEHIAYWILKPGPSIEYERIPARGKDTGLLMAFLVYGNRYRLDNHRGIPLIAVILETIKKLERYKEAAVASAEERAKIAYFIEHGIGSDGENPLIQQAAAALGIENTNKVNFPTDDQLEHLAKNIAATTNKQTYNMPIMSTLKALETKNELFFRDFYTVNIDLMCACVGIPPNVAMSKYDSNYSASRAAIQDWSHSLKVRRKSFANQFEKPIYSFWFHIYVLQNIINAPGFIGAWLQRKWMVVESYLRARFVGVNVPHIDPLKEVQAIRLMLGGTGASLPLTTLEAGTEQLGAGGAIENMEQYAAELEQSKALGIEIEVPETEPVKDDADDE